MCRQNKQTMTAAKNPTNVQAVTGIARREIEADTFNITTFAVRVKHFSAGRAISAESRRFHPMGKRIAGPSSTLLNPNIDFFPKSVHKLVQHPYSVSTL